MTSNLSGVTTRGALHGQGGRRTERGGDTLADTEQPGPLANRAGHDDDHDDDHGDDHDDDQVLLPTGQAMMMTLDCGVLCGQVYDGTDSVGHCPHHSPR